jgi:hypothetical protein
MKKELNGMKPLTENNRTTWLQTDRETHELWAELAIKKPRAGTYAYFLCPYG